MTVMSSAEYGQGLGLGMNNTLAHSGRDKGKVNPMLDETDDNFNTALYSLQKKQSGKD